MEPKVVTLNRFDCKVMFPDDNFPHLLCFKFTQTLILSFQVTEVGPTITVQYLRSLRGNRATSFSYPQEEDFDTIHPSKIEKILAKPVDGRRGALVFKDLEGLDIQ